MDRLTDREGQVLAFLSEGLSNRAIAARLRTTLRTVETHINRIFTKLELFDDSAVHRRVHAALAHQRALQRKATLAEIHSPHDAEHRDTARALSASAIRTGSAAGG